MVPQREETIIKTKLFPSLALMITFVAGAGYTLFNSVSFGEALTRGKAEEKPVLVELRADGSHFCRKMSRKTASDKTDQQSLKDFILMKADVDAPEGGKLERDDGITGLPPWPNSIQKDNSSTIVSVINPPRHYSNR